MKNLYSLYVSFGSLVSRTSEQLLISVLIFTINICSAQNDGGQLSVILRDSTTQEYLPFASVQIMKAGKRIAANQTDMNGKVVFKDLNPGNYSVTGSFLGFKSFKMDEISVNQNKTTSIERKMSTGEGQMLKVVNITACYVDLIDGEVRSGCCFCRCGGDCFTNICGRYSAMDSTEQVADPEIKKGPVSERSLSVFPNPTAGVINIVSDSLRSADPVLYIQNIDGKLVQEKHIEAEGPVFRSSLDLSSYARGVYFVRLIDGQLSSVKGSWSSRKNK